MSRRPQDVVLRWIIFSLPVAVLLATWCPTAHAAPAPASPAPVVTLHGDRLGKPISPFIYGQFIEHLGRCIYGGIWAEMLEDRKFYFPITAEYRPYRSLEDSPFPVVGASPWQIIGSADAVTMVEKDAFVGEHTPQIKAGAGIRQRDLALVAGKDYVGYIWLAASKSAASVKVSLAWGNSENARQTIAIKGIKSKYQRHPLRFTAGAGVDKAMLEILALGGDVLVGTVSLMPADNVRGMRADTLDLLQQLGATMYRWPGGNFVSGYNWRDGIGDRDRRPPRKNPAWTGVEHNDFGLDEFIDFCREVGAEPVIAANTGFGDDYSAAQEVEYCNRGTDTIGGSWRAKNGHKKPYGVKYWCVGNEMFGPWQLGFMQLSHYVQKHTRVAQAMWKVDPSLQLIGVGSLGEFNRRNDPEQKVGWTEGMLADCAAYMNYISEHFYRGRTPWAPENPDIIGHVGLLKQSIIQKAEGHRKLQKELGLLDTRPVPIAMDEWNYWHQPYVYGELGCQYDLADALGVAVGLHEYYRNSDIIQMAHYAQTVNVIGCIKTTKTAAFFDATALPLMLYRHEYGSIPIEVTGDHTAAALDVAAAWTADRKAVTIGVVNPNTEAKAIELKLEGITLDAKGTGWRIQGDDPKLHNDAENERLQIIEVPVQWDSPMKVAPLSITLVRFPVR
ncbi:MAG: alpha-N-arabinofuranosidase [Phycisphaerae bacterium]|nr:alpha-N-arabinofuranosidase [Phycisphaerae bacterium]